MEKLLSLCMIVKNEEKVLRRCLESVQNLVDEIIIIDTGSTDTTKAIASEYTEQVYDFTWINDFAAARNESIRRASGRWILWLDADEYVQREQHQELREFLNQQCHSMQPQCLVLPILNFMGESEAKDIGFSESSAARIFSNGHQLFFHGAIHEQVVSPDGQFKHINYLFHIYHSGYTQQVVKEKDKSGRNLQIFEELKQNKQLNTPYGWFTLANEYASTLDYQKALYYYEKAYRRSKGQSAWSHHCLSRMILSYNELKRYKEALQLTEEGLSNWPHYSDFHTIKGLLLDTFGYYRSCQRQMEQSIAIAKKKEASNQKYWLIFPEYGKFTPFRKLAEIYYRQRNLPKTVFMLTKVLKMESKQYDALCQLAHLLTQKESEEDVISFFEKLYQKNETANRLLLFETFLLLGHPTLSQHYYNLCMERELQLSDVDMLRYHLILNDSNQFKDKMRETDFSSSSSEAYKLLLLAALTWNEPAYLQPFAENKDEETARLYSLGQALLVPESGDLADQEGLLYSTLIDLFTIKSFDAYDLLVNRFARPSLLNKLAHYFYNQNYIDMALNYYSILIENNKMEATGYLNLAFLYLYEGDFQEGLDFLAQAIELQPKQMHLYGIWMEHCTDPTLNQKYKAQFDSQFPSCRNIQFI